MQNNIDLSGLIQKAREEDVLEIHISKYLPHYKTFFRDGESGTIMEKESIVIYNYYSLYENAVECNEVEEVKLIPSTSKGFNLYLKLKDLGSSAIYG